MKVLTPELARKLAPGDILCLTGCMNRGKRDMSCMRWRVNGEVKTWVKSPDDIVIPLKHGLYDYAYAYAGTWRGQNNALKLERFHIHGSCPECRE